MGKLQPEVKSMSHLLRSTAAGRLRLLSQEAIPQAVTYLKKEGYLLLRNRLWPGRGV